MLLIGVFVIFMSALLFVLVKASRDTKEYQKQKVTELQKQTKIFTTTSTNSIEGAEQDVLKKYIQHIGTHGASLKLNSGAIFQKFIELMPGMGVFSNFGDGRTIPGKNTPKEGYVVLEGTVDGGAKIWLQLMYEWRNPSEYLDGHTWQEINPFFGEEGLRVITRIFMVYPTQLASQMKTEGLRLLNEQAFAHRTPENKVAPHKATFWKIEEGKIVQSGIELFPRFSSEGEDILYDPFSVNQGEKQYTIPVSKLIPMVSRWTLEPYNTSTAFYGAAGTGKTAFLLHLASILGQDPKVRVFGANELWLQKDLVQYLDPNFKNVLLFDEAEKFFAEYTPQMKNLMGGLTGVSHNVTCLLAFNGEPSDFPEELFRTGRCVPMEIPYIDIRKKGRLDDVALYISTRTDVGLPNSQKLTELLKQRALDDGPGNGFQPLSEIFAACSGNIFDFHAEEEIPVLHIVGGEAKKKRKEIK